MRRAIAAALLLVLVALLAAAAAGCGSAGAPARSSVAYERSQDGPITGCARFHETVHEVAGDSDVDPGLLAGIITVESRWRPRATSSAGARGLMQIMPSTGRRLRCGDLYDARDNLSCGARLLDRLLRRYDGRVDYALAAYALGPARPDRAFADGDEAPRQRFIRRVLDARLRWLERGCSS